MPSSSDDALPPSAHAPASADARLAARIAERLVAERLIDAADAAAVREGLAAGQLSKAQWREWADGDGADGDAADGAGASRG